MLQWSNAGEIARLGLFLHAPELASYLISHVASCCLSTENVMDQLADLAMTEHREKSINF